MITLKETLQKSLKEFVTQATYKRIEVRRLTSHGVRLESNLYASSLELFANTALGEPLVVATTCSGDYLIFDRALRCHCVVDRGNCFELLNLHIEDCKNLEISNLVRASI